MLRIIIHTFIQILLFFKSFCSTIHFIYFSCFYSSSLKKDKSVFWCTFLKFKTRKWSNWRNKQTRYQKQGFVFFFFFTVSKLSPICLFNVVLVFSLKFVQSLILSYYLGNCNHESLFCLFLFLLNVSHKCV